MFNNVVLAVSGSDHAHRAVPVAAELAKLAGGKVIVLHVREHDRARGQVWELETQEVAETVVRHTVDEIKKAGATAEGEVIRTALGKVAEALVDSARDHKADAIVMGSWGRSDLAGLVLGSVAHKVIHLSDKTVVVAR
ncbi:MAG TPA: universal stress protein [Candidatus Dormibacteraeota bacterium]|nr:universal stress protein [Candidatus Dormibacteraeota bacterium]